MDTAFFVRHPRTADDLRKPHLLSAERPYAVVAEVALNAIDYDNFISDMLVDREFIEAAADKCSEGELMKCLLVRSRRKAGGILLVPERKASVAWAAYV